MTDRVNPAAREFDLVLYGATGYVGKLTADYLAQQAPPGARIALAGRSQRRLDQVIEHTGPAARPWQTVIADATDPDSLNDMAARTQVVITTVGPYSEHGLPLVGACAKAGTDYVDLTGESLFVRDSINNHHKHATDTGARIVHSCGFDSIPSDISVHLIFQQACTDQTGDLEDTTLLLRSMRGGVSGGSAASGLAQAVRMAQDKEQRRLALDPYTLSPDRVLEPELGKQPDAPLLRASSIHPSLRGWTAGFFMAGYNTRVVRRSNALLDWGYGRRFRYREMMSLGSSPFSAIPAAAIAGGLTAGIAVIPALRVVPNTLLLAATPKSGTGPSEQSRRRGHFTMQTFARTSTAARYRADFAMRGDPGYAATAVMLGESGLCLAFDRPHLPKRSGVLTPATAMGNALAARLAAAGVTLTVTRV
jgi:short subunit dehydrogenase-like uncharacterized protein